MGIYAQLLLILGVSRWPMVLPGLHTERTAVDRQHSLVLLVLLSPGCLEKFFSNLKSQRDNLSRVRLEAEENAGKPRIPPRLICFDTHQATRGFPGQLDSQ